MNAFARLVGFGRALRGRGLPVGTGRILSFLRAAAMLVPLDRGRLYWAGRATLVSTRAGVDVYDDVFADYFRDETFAGLTEGLMDFLAGTSDPRADQASVDPAYGGVERLAGWVEEDEAAGAEGEAAVALVASGAEVLRTKSFESMSAAERAVADRLIRSLAIGAPKRRVRRTHAASAGRRFDVRRTVRASFRTYGEPVDRRWRARTIRRRPLVLVLDVSASMSAYSRALMQFAHAAMRAGGRVEVFCFGTRLTRVTRVLKRRDPDAALEGVAAAVTDWEGGTRIGDSLKEMLDRYAHTASLRASVAVLCSDGLERGDPAVLEAQMERLGRLTHRVVWVNPLKGDPRYQPLARGMAAALPHIDVFLAGHNLASLETLSAAVAA